MRRLLAVLLALLAAWAPAPALAQERSTVLLVGVPALAWEHVTETGTPTLWSLARQGAVASLSVRSARTPETRRFDGWATLSAGHRAAAPDGRSDVPSLREHNERYDFDAEVGALGVALRSADLRAEAAGAGARLAVSGTDGTAPPPGTDLVVVELPQLYERGRPALPEIDRAVAELAGRYAPRDLLVVGVSDTATGPAGLRVALATGASYGRGALVSASTRRPGYVQLIDVAPTVLSLLGAPVPASMAGQRWRVTGGAPPVAELVDADRASDAHRRYTPPFFTVMVAAQLGLYAAAWLVLRRRRVAGSRRRPLLVTGWAALGFAAVPVATYLVNLLAWWRRPLWFLVASVVAVALAVVAVAVAGPWRRRAFGPPGVVAGVTAVVLAADLLTGARLQMSSLSGYSPIVAGRFAGVGNVAFAILGTSALLAVAALCAGRPRGFRVAVVAAAGAFVVAVDGSPLWGSDFGGVLALVPAFAVLGLLLTGSRVSAWRLVLVAAAAVAVVAAFAVLDYARPPDARTHLGRFVAQVMDGGAWTVVERKAKANLRLLTHSVLTLVVPIAVGFLGFVLLRPWGGLRRALDRSPELRAGLLATLVLGVVGFAANDSGVAVPSLALTVAVPVALAVTCRSAAEEDGG